MVILLDIVQSWVKWLLYSPVRFVLIVVGISVVLGTAVVVNRTTGEEPQPEAAAASSAAAPSSSSSASAGDTTPSDSETDAPLTPEETATAETLARDFVKAWGATAEPPEKWLSGVEPYCSDELKSRMQWVDPRQSEPHTVDEKAPVRKADPLDEGSHTTFGVLTDKGLVYVEVVKDEIGALKANNVYTGVGGE